MPETYQEHSYEQIQEALNNEKSAKEYYEKGINVINQYIKEVKSKENLFWKDATKPFLDLKAKLESTQQRLIDYKWFDDKANIELVAKNINEADKDVLKNLNSFKSLQEIGKKMIDKEKVSVEGSGYKEYYSGNKNTLLDRWYQAIEENREKFDINDFSNKLKEIERQAQSNASGIKLIEKTVDNFRTEDISEKFLQTGDLQKFFDYKDDIVMGHENFDIQKFNAMKSAIEKNKGNMQIRNKEIEAQTDTKLFETFGEGELHITEAGEKKTINQLGLDTTKIYKIHYNFTLYKMDYLKLKNEIESGYTHEVNLEGNGDSAEFYIRWEGDQKTGSFVLLGPDGNPIIDKKTGRYMRPKIYKDTAIITAATMETKAKLNQGFQQVNEEQKLRESVGKLSEEERKQCLKDMPRQLRSALHKKAKEKDPDAQFDNNELLNNLIEKTEKRLDEICRDMSQKGYRLQIDLTSKTWIETGLMQVHFIKSDDKADVTVWKYKEGLGRDLYELIDGSFESEYMNYITQRLSGKMEKFSSLRPKEKLQNCNVDPQGMSAEEFNNALEKQNKNLIHLNEGCRLLEQFINKVRESEGDSYVSSYDQKLVGMLEHIDKMRNTMNSQEKQLLDINKILQPFMDGFWNKVLEKNSIGYSDNPQVQEMLMQDLRNRLKNSIYQIFGQKEGQDLNDVQGGNTQADGIRNLDKLLSVYNKTDSSDFTEDIILQDNFSFVSNKDTDDAVEVEGEQTRMIELNTQWKSINTLFTVDENDSEDEIKKKEERITKLYQCYSIQDVANFLMNEKLMPNCPEQDNEDFKKKMGECCKNLLKQIETKKEQIKQMEYKIDNSEYFDSMIDQKLQKLTELKSRMNSLSQEEKTELYHLEYLNNHRDVLRKNVQEIYKGTIHALKFSGIEELIKTTMLPSFLQVAKTNSDFVNDRYGLDGLLDFTDENAKAVGDFCIDVAIDIAVGVATAGVGELALGAAVKGIQAALKIGKGAMSLKNLKRFLKAEKILRSILAEGIEQTVNISLTNIAQGLKRGKIDQFVSCYDVFNAVCLTKGLTGVGKKMGVLGENLSKRLGEKTKESLQKILDSRIRRGGEGVAKPVGILGQSSVGNLFSELLSVGVDNIKMNDFNTMLNSLGIFVDDKERQELLNSIKKEFQDNLNLETNLTISSPENILRALLKTRGIQQCRKMGLTRAENITSKYQFDAWGSQNKKYQREKNKTQAQQQKEQEKNKKTELSENTLSIGGDNISFVDAENLMIHVGIESMTPAAGETVVSQNEQTPEAELPQVQNQSADSTKVQIPSQEGVSQDSTKVANVPQVQQVLNSNQGTNVNQ